jgi:hypothetical protein
MFPYFRLITPVLQEYKTRECAQAHEPFLYFYLDKMS